MSQYNMTEKTSIVFLGTPEFACPFLEKLAADRQRFDILAVITQEDKVQGRKRLPAPPPVKTTAEKLGLPVYQPARLNKDGELLEKLEQMAPDFLLVIAYGQILSPRVLAIPSIKPINVHGSILPLYRGASPVEQALLNGDSTTGLSIMAMEAGMDTGPVYSVINCPIAPDDTSPSLRRKLSELGSAELPELLLQIKSGGLRAQPQDDSRASYCGKISKSDGLTDPAVLDANTVYNRWRAYFPWPGISVQVKEIPLKLLKIRPVKVPGNPSAPSAPSPAPGRFLISDKRLFLGCQSGAVEILELQLPGKSAQPTTTFLAGNSHYFA